MRYNSQTGQTGKVSALNFEGTKFVGHKRWQTTHHHWSGGSLVDITLTT